MEKFRRYIQGTASSWTLKSMGYVKSSDRDRIDRLAEISIKVISLFFFFKDSIRVGLETWIIYSHLLRDFVYFHVSFLSWGRWTTIHTVDLSGSSKPVQFGGWVKKSQSPLNSTQLLLATSYIAHLGKSKWEEYPIWNSNMGNSSCELHIHFFLCAWRWNGFMKICHQVSRAM